MDYIKDGITSYVFDILLCFRLILSLIAVFFFKSVFLMRGDSQFGHDHLCLCCSTLDVFSYLQTMFFAVSFFMRELKH